MQQYSLESTNFFLWNTCTPCTSAMLVCGLFSTAAPRAGWSNINIHLVRMSRNSELAMLTTFLLEYKGFSGLLSTSKFCLLELGADALLLRSSGSDNAVVGGIDAKRPVLCKNQWPMLVRDCFFLLQTRGSIAIPARSLLLRCVLEQFISRARWCCFDTIQSQA